MSKRYKVCKIYQSSWRFYLIYNSITLPSRTWHYRSHAIQYPLVRILVSLVDLDHHLAKLSQLSSLLVSHCRYHRLSRAPYFLIIWSRLISTKSLQLEISL